MGGATIAVETLAVGSAAGSLTAMTLAMVAGIGAIDVTPFQFGTGAMFGAIADGEITVSTIAGGTIDLTMVAGGIAGATIEVGTTDSAIGRGGTEVRVTFYGEEINCRQTSPITLLPIYAS